MEWVKHEVYVDRWYFGRMYVHKEGDVYRVYHGNGKKTDIERDTLEECKRVVEEADVAAFRRSQS